MAPMKQLSTADSYTVGWIAALPKELTAATAILDEEHRRPAKFKKHPNDANNYHWGKIGEHNVIIACLPTGSYGEISAASTAWSMQSSLPHLRFGLMVGIGAGIPRLEDNIDIRLGDVAVSVPRGTSSGVIQYDLGKVTGSGLFEQVGTLDRPPNVLLTALTKLQAKHDRDGPEIPMILDSMIERYPRMRETGFVYQQSKNDRLFDASDSTKELERPMRSTDPRIHYGVIASGNQVIKHGITRDEILRRLGGNCICFEMEAAGLMNSFPCLVIRGICDYADSHKNDQWQNYAAATAAAFAKELLQVMDGEDIEREETMEQIQDRISQVENVVTQTYSEVKSQRKGSYLEKLSTWINAPDPSTNYNKADSQRHGNSGQWFLESSEYARWKATPNSFLWLHGIPGCGKTVLSSTIIKDLNKKYSANLVYFYFDFKDPTKQSLQEAMRSLISQMYTKMKATQTQVDKLFSYCNDGVDQPGIGALRKTLQEMLKKVDDVWIVLDALDECQDYIDLLEWMQYLHEGWRGNIHLLATSRHVQQIADKINQWTGSENIIALKSEMIEQDIKDYVRTQVRTSNELSRWRKHASGSEIQDEIETVLVERAHGMFRWVECQLVALKDCLDYRDLTETLKDLPEGLDETYDVILKKIPHGHIPHTYKILQFLAFSKGSLKVTELADALAVDVDSKPRFNPKNRMPVPTEIWRYCNSLVTMTERRLEPEGEMITELQLAHYSVKEYLTSNRLNKEARKQFKQSVAGQAIAQVCLVYLSELNHSLSLDEIKRDFPFANYAAKNWQDHARPAERANKSNAISMEFFSSPSAFATSNGLRFPNLGKPGDPFPGILSYACYGGLIKSVKTLLEKGEDPNDDGGVAYGSPIHTAASKGYRDVVDILISHGSNINLINSERGTPLQTAAAQGHRKVIELLLNAGADPNLQGGYYGTALQAASSKGSRKSVTTLLNNGADPNARCGEHGTAIHAASRKGHSKTVVILLQNGAVVERDAFLSASSEGHSKVIDVLLETDLGALDSSLEILQASIDVATSNNHQKIVAKLQAHKAQISSEKEKEITVGGQNRRDKIRSNHKHKDQPD